jgi:addiction module HigA family antidote
MVIENIPRAFAQDDGILVVNYLWIVRACLPLALVGSNSRLSEKRPDMKKKLLPLTTPGEVLNEEFLLPLGITQYRLAKDIGISARRINEIVLGKRAITPNTALRLGKYFGVSAQFWLNLQVRYDLQTEERTSDFLARIHPCPALMAA